MNRPQEWHDERRNYIGASEVSTLLGFNDYMTPWELWLLKTGQMEPFEGNEATEIGNELEGVILNRAEKDLGPLRRDVIVCHGDRLRATLDAITVESDDVVEAKTSGIASRGKTDEWGEEGEVTELGQVPTGYYLQVQAQLLCSAAEAAWLYALVGGRGFLRYRIVPNPAIMSHIDTTCHEWWQRHIVDGQAVPRGGVVPSMKTLSRIIREPESVVELDHDVAELVDKREWLASIRKQHDIVTAEILVKLGTAEKGILPDGRIVTYREQSRREYTVPASSYRVFRVSKGE